VAKHRCDSRAAGMIRSARAPSDARRGRFPTTIDSGSGAFVRGQKSPTSLHKWVRAQSLAVTELTWARQHCPKVDYVHEAIRARRSHRDDRPRHGGERQHFHHGRGWSKACKSDTKTADCRAVYVPHAAVIGDIRSIATGSRDQVGKKFPTPRRCCRCGGILGASRSALKRDVYSDNASCMMFGRFMPADAS